MELSPAAAPPAVGIGTPISDTAVWTVGAVERVARISIGTDDATAHAARRVGSAFGPRAGLPNLLVSHGRRLVGAGGRPDPVGRGERNRRYHNEESKLVHRPFPSCASRNGRRL